VSILASIAVPEELRGAVSERAWLEAMLDAERALANAGSLAGAIPAAAAAVIAEQCRAELYDWSDLAERGRAVGNPAEPLVRALRLAVGREAAHYVHYGATSQDIVDTAGMLVARRAVALILAELDGAAAAAAGLARRHRSTPAAARTLLQQAVPTTFGLRAAGWLVALLEARRGLRGVELAAQLGGAAGTLAPLGQAGMEVLRLYAAELDLAEPPVPWHTNRVRVAQLGGALDVAAGVAAKIGLDVILLSQTELAEVAEQDGGASSTMPQKRNPVGSTLARACALQVHGHVSVLTAPHELERAAGAWHAEWDALTGALAYAGGAAAAIRRVLEGLQVDEQRMRANMRDELTAEQVAYELGRERADELLAAGGPFPDPTAYLGSAEAFVDRALALWEEERGGVGSTEPPSSGGAGSAGAGADQ
jgi:3-carboxy-cis,cis-muconate cycloisomerase